MSENRALRTQIATTASRQHGCVTRKQLLTIGLGAEAIRSRVANGELIRVHAGVYGVGTWPTTPIARGHAAVLACGPDAVLSHGSALALYGLGRWPRVPIVTSLEQRRRPGIVSHRTRRPERWTHFGVPASPLHRVIADLQAGYDDRRLVRLTHEARLSGFCKLDKLLTASPRIRKLIDPQQRPSRSPLEDRFARFVRRHGLPMPRVNHVLPGGREVDAYYSQAQLIVELDSWHHHRTRAAFERDRAKDRHALADGMPTIRLTSDALDRDGTEEAAQIRAILCRAASRSPR